MHVLVRKNNQQRGPYTEAEVRERLKSGVFSGSDLGQVEGESEWKPLAEILLASVLATDNRTATPSPGRDLTANYPWLRDPKIIGGAVVLLLLIFGGINWLNKASERRRENAIAARQATAMEQAEKQAAAMLQKEQERAAQARQAQLDQVKQMMSYSEKAQKDYQERQKREQEERQKAEQAKIDAAQRQKQEEVKQADQRRLAAEAKQKAQEAELLKNRPKPVATAANTNAPTATPAAITLASMPLAPMPKEREKIVFSDDRARVFVIASQGSRVQAIVDGVSGPLCRKLRWPLQRASLAPASYNSSLGMWPDNTPVKGPPPFSPDKKRVAYITELDAGKEAVVIDSAQSPVYDRIGWIGFGPNGHHFAYVAVNNKAGARGETRSIVTMVDNGKAGPSFDDIASASYKRGEEALDKGGIVFSADGEHLAYIGVKQSPQRSHSRVMIDGRADPHEYEHIRDLQISRDGQHWAYTVRYYVPNNMGGGVDESKVVVDGRESPAAPFIEKLVLSDDGSRFAYVARGNKNDEPSALVDQGVKGPKFRYITNVVVSANGKRVAYIAAPFGSQGSAAVVVDNGKQSVPYDNCGGISVSADGSILSFFADSSQGKLLVVNGQEFGPFRRINDNLTYSADGKHWACSLEATDSSESGQFLIDGETYPVPKGARYSGTFRFDFRPDRGWYAKALNCELEIKTATPEVKVPSQVVYSRDGQHVAKIWPNSQDSTHSSEQATLDDKPVGPSYHRINDLQLSDDGKHIAFSASVGDSRGSGDAVVFDGEEGPKHSGIYDVVMTPDGRHIAYSAGDRVNDAGTWHVVVDGFAGPAFDYDRNYYLASTKVNLDGSLTFIAALKGQLARYTYPAEALKFMPTMSQTENVTPGVRILQMFERDYVSRHVVVGPNGRIYGTTAEGGDYGHGFLFSIKTDGSDRKIIHSFYGNNDDGGDPVDLVLGQDRIIYGAAGSVIFRYDPAKNEYGVAAKGQFSNLRTSGPRLVTVFADGSLLFEEGDDFRLMQKGSSNVEEIRKPHERTKLAAVGPDGAIYSVSEDSLLRQSTVYSPPTVLHKFVDSPEDAKTPHDYITFDASGVIYGSASNRQANRDIIYRVNHDGSDYRVLVKQGQGFGVDAIAVGDDGALYASLFNKSNEKQSGLFRLSTENGTPEFLNIPDSRTQFRDRPPVWHDMALYYSGQETLIKVQLPRTREAARINSVVAIKNVAPPPLTLVEPITFTASSGEVIPTPRLAAARPGPTVPQPIETADNTLPTANRPNPLLRNRVTPPPDPDYNSTENPVNDAPSGQSLSQEEASAFAENNARAMSGGDVNALTTYYANQVDYLDEGFVSSDVIRRDLEQYFARWPQTSWEVNGAVTVQSLTPSRYQITFPVSFEAVNPATHKRSAGVARETMVLERDDTGAWKIVRQRETVTSNKADDRRRWPERKKVYRGQPVEDNRPRVPLPPNIPWPSGLPRP